MKKIMFILACFVVITSLVVGCNAYRGLGKDVEKTGEAIQGK